MDDGVGPDGLSFLGGSVPMAFELRLVALPPDDELPFVEAEWRDSLVVVERGALELVGGWGPAGRFLRGDILCLVGLGLRSLRCGSRDATLLTVVRRRGRGSPTSVARDS